MTQRQSRAVSVGRVGRVLFCVTATVAVTAYVTVGRERERSLFFTVMGGFMAATGVLTVYVALTALARRSRSAAIASAGSTVLSLCLMSGVNFVLGSDFRWLLVVPPSIGLSAIALYVRGR